MGCARPVSWFRVFTQRLDWPYDLPMPDILSPEECRRYLRLERSSVRTRYAQSRVFLRHTLSRFAPVAPGEWEFGYGEFGRPHVAGPSAGLGLNFNLSHTRDYAACVVTGGAGCGIDIELIHHTPYLMRIARRRYAPEEYAELERLDEPARLERFFVMWTEKEAWAKAKGEGLRLSTNMRIAELPGVQLHRPTPPPGHAISVILLTAS